MSEPFFIISNELFILQDSSGYVTATSNEHSILREIAKRPMLAPITIFHWHLHSYPILPATWFLHTTDIYSLPLSKA